MDEKKLLDLLNFKKEKEEKPLNDKVSSSSFSFQTNPILERMMFFRLQNKNNKFNIKDLFK